MSHRYGYPGPAGYDPSAEDALPSFAELFSARGSPLAAVERVRGELGLPGAEVPQASRPGPDVTGLAEHLGIG